MALDHFVPQVHLRRFVSPSLGNRLFAVRKKDGFRFTPRTQDVCRIDEGSTNSYLAEPRAMEEFLKGVEPKYNESVDALEGGSTAELHIQVVAGFIAYVASCSPTGMRLFIEPLRTAVEATAAMLESSGQLPPPPEILNAATLTDLLRDGRVKVLVDPKYPQAIGITQVVRLVEMLESFDWEILHSPSTGKVFLTSDFPAAVEEVGLGRPINRVVPLTPRLAVRLVPGSDAQATHDSRVVLGARRHRVVGGHEVVEICRAVVRCAEETVFMCEDPPWAADFVEANRRYRLCADVRSFPTGTGSVQFASVKVTNSEG